LTASVVTPVPGAASDRAAQRTEAVAPAGCPFTVPDTRQVYRPPRGQPKPAVAPPDPKVSVPAEASVLPSTARERAEPGSNPLPPQRTASRPSWSVCFRQLSAVSRIFT